ncbi:MAG: cupin domain-containing protein [Casimicrobiaceae bacterium]
MKTRCRSFPFLVSGAVALAMSAFAFAAAAPGAPEQVLINARSIRWSAAPPSLPKGAKVAVLYGDPSGSGPFVMRMLLPAKYKVPFHWHTEPEQLTVLSGELFIANDATYDKKYARAVKPGGFLFLPAKAQQYAFTKKATIVEVYGTGPFDVKYVDPNNDPAKWEQAKTYYFPKKFEANEMNAPEAGEPIPTF